MEPSCSPATARRSPCGCFGFDLGVLTHPLEVECAVRAIGEMRRRAFRAQTGSQMTQALRLVVALHGLVATQAALDPGRSRSAACAQAGEHVRLAACLFARDCGSIAGFAERDRPLLFASAAAQAQVLVRRLATAVSVQARLAGCSAGFNGSSTALVAEPSGARDLAEPTKHLGVLRHLHAPIARIASSTERTTCAGEPVHAAHQATWARVRSPSPPLLRLL